MKTPQVPALPGMTPLGLPAMTPKQKITNRIIHHNVTLDDGRIVALFVNRDSNLVVLDIIDADEKGGNEVYRHKV
jgi:hypothetical protein